MNQRRLAEAYNFFRSWLRDPLLVAAVVPSGRALAELITSEISPATGPVIELGPGTGVFTRALTGRGVRQQNLALIELEPHFAIALQSDYPNAHTFQIDAARLSRVDLFDGRPAGAVISGLPLLTIPSPQVLAILISAFGKMRADGAFYQFTYGPGCPVSPLILDRLGLRAERIGGTFANFPPAAVYRLRRRAETSHSLRGNL